MSRRYGWMILLTVFLGSVVLVSLVGAGDSQIDEINALIANEKKERGKLQARIKKQNKALSRMGKKESSSFKKLQVLEDRLKMRQRELKIYQWNMKINQKKIAKLTKSIAVTRKQLSRKRNALIQRLRIIYKEGSLFPVKILFAAGDFNDLLQRIKYMETVADYDSALFRKYDERFNSLSREKEALLHARGKLLHMKEAAVEKRQDIKREKTEKQAFLKRLKKEKRLNKKLKRELVKSADKLNQIIARLEEKLVLGEGLDITDKKGRLSVPVRGRYLNKFGRKRDKQYDTYIVYNGINIRSPKGTPARAIFDGKVLYSGALEGYGNLVILGHGKEYHSLYGHLDEIVADVGKVVRSGQIIGRTGDTGSLVGESLYFELRYKGKPIEPTVWFSRSKK